MLDSGFSDFFRQLPPFLILLFCGSSLALIAVVAVIVNTRSKRTRSVEAAVPAPAAAANFNYAESPLPEDSDLPDLDELLKVTPPTLPPRRPGPPGATTVTVTTSAGETVDALAVMTILRDVEDGGLLIQIGDRVFRNPPALADAEFKRRFNSTVRDLYQSIGDTSLTKKATGEVAAARPESAEAPPTAPRPAAPPLPSAPRATGTSLPGDLPKFKMPDTIEKPKRGRRQPSEPVPEINIAEAIEEFLQYKLSITPEYAARSIHVRPAVGGGLRIDVDENSYEMVGDVEDTDVRAFLQATIDEWQSRQ
jgi:hypothetical protein